MFDKFGKVQGYGQMAPGRDSEVLQEEGQPGRPRKQQNINSAITGGLPVGNQPFAGAAQTIGGMAPQQAIPQAQPQAAPAPSAMDRLGPQGNPSPTAGLAQPAPPKPSYEGWGQFMPQGLEQSNVQKGVTDPKYQIAQIQSHFDPRQGITPELVQALNGLGIGQFRSDARDKLYVDGQMDPRFKDVVSSDIINSYDPGKGGTWNGWGGTSVDPQPSAGMGQAQMPMNVGTAIAGQPQGGDYASQLMKQIMQTLQNNPKLAGLGKQFGGY